MENLGSNRCLTPIQDAWRFSGESLHESNQGLTLDEYVQTQRQLLSEQLPLPLIEAPSTTAIKGADKVLQLALRYMGQAGQEVRQRQPYIRCGPLVSVVTFTTTTEELARVHIDFLAIVENMSVRQASDQNSALR